MKKVYSPISNNDIKNLKVGDMISITGQIICGRDAVLPKLLEKIKSNDGDYEKLDLEGNIVFHTAVSEAGIGPTSSNKLEIESSIIPLSSYGIKMHIGKGEISRKTIKKLNDFNSCFAIVPPVSALLMSKIKKMELIDFGDLGMEALYSIEVYDFPAIIAAINGRSIYDK